MTQYAISTLHGRVLGFLESDTMPVLHDPQRIAHVMIQPVAGWPSAPTPTSELWIANGELRWVETSTLEQLCTDAVAKTYPDVDAIYEAAVGSRTVEYQKAEAAARAYQAAEVKPSPASIYITSHALNNPTGQVQSEAWAAQQIIEKADAFAWAVAQMRDVRAASQGRMRAATTPGELEAVEKDWHGFILWVRDVLGLPTATPEQ